MDAETSPSAGLEATGGQLTCPVGARRDLAVCCRVEHGEVWISVAGVLDYATRDLLAVVVHDALMAKCPDSLVVDLGRVRLLDASVIGMLLRAQQLADGCHAALRVANPHGIVRDALQATGSLSVLAGSPTEAGPA
ncbi:STAS domain-containing protein [Dactylosporangium cerinum]|uniref:STAS domain-containing protein n=1 Tax=Dactylosporangium cerinum TaxID=1434730 RepID=A0ABV9VTK8_9ACTN